MWLDHLPPIHMCPLEPDPLPLCVDVINGWLLYTGISVATDGLCSSVTLIHGPGVEALTVNT